MKKIWCVAMFGVMLLVSGRVGQARAEEVVVSQSILEQEVVYYLPYPGILPDHPVYWLKMLRDKLVEATTTGAEASSNLWTRYADKRLGAAKVLIEGNKTELGLDTAKKAVGYLEKAVVQVEALRAGGNEVGDLANKMERETLKHAQILDQLARNRTGDEAAILNSLKERVINLHERIVKVLGRN